MFSVFFLYALIRWSESERGGHGSVGLHRWEELPMERDVQLSQTPAEEAVPVHHVCLPYQWTWRVWWGLGMLKEKLLCLIEYSKLHWILSHCFELLNIQSLYFTVWESCGCQGQGGLCMHVSKWRSGKARSHLHSSKSDWSAVCNFFFPSLKLPRFIEKLTNEMKEAGNLEGILLTGLTKDGVDLMESYVDRTGDVQTASFCMLKVTEQ